MIHLASTPSEIDDERCWKKCEELDSDWTEAKQQTLKNSSSNEDRALRKSIAVVKLLKESSCC